MHKIATFAAVIALTTVIAPAQAEDGRHAAFAAGAAVGILAIHPPHPAPVYGVAPAPVYVVPSPPGQPVYYHYYYYYCPHPSGYYPTVPRCPVAWQVVPAPAAATVVPP